MANYGTFSGNVTPAQGDYLLESSQDNIVAFPGGGATNATQITAQTSRITVVATAGDSVRLPDSTAGLELLIINHGNNPVQVYGYKDPVTGMTDTINDISGSVGVSQMQNSFVLYSCAGNGNWYTEGLASGFVRGATSLQTFSAVDGLTANAGSAQANATPLTAMMNRVVTVAVSGNSVVLPPSAVGMDIAVTNAHATNAINVFPSAGGTGTETINALAANAAFSLAATKSVQFLCYTPGQWHTLLSA